MNKFIQAVTDLNLPSIEELLQQKPAWLTWSEKSDKNALHFLCGVSIGKDSRKAETSLQILKLLLISGMDINSVHKIPEKHGFFPATPLWYAYTRGRNEKLFTYLLKNGADPNHCMFAIAWYDDVKSATLFKKFGANIVDASGSHTPFLAAFEWKKFDVAEWFLKNGADVNVVDPKGNTALFYAVKRKYDIEYIKLLLKYGADVNKKNNEGISPKKLAEVTHQRKVMNLLRLGKS